MDDLIAMLELTADDVRGINASAARALANAEHFAARAEAAEDPEVANAYARSGSTAASARRSCSSSGCGLS